MQPSSSQYATYSGTSSPPNSASDELVDDNLLLKDFLVCHSSHILQPQALYIFHFDERTTWTWCAACFICIWNEELLNIMRYSKLLNKFRCVMIRMDSFVVVTLRFDTCASVCRSSLNINQSLQFAFIRLEISDSISYNTYKFANYRKDSSWDPPSIAWYAN